MLGLILNELATNALKHGAWSNTTGRVEIVTTESTTSDELQILWREHEGPPAEGLVTPGLGTKLINLGLRRGTVRHELRPDGLRCQIELPVSRSQRLARRS